MTIDWKLVFTFWALLLVVIIAFAADVTPAQVISVDWTIVLVAALTAIPLTIAQIATLVVTLRNSSKVEKIHVATNSMKDALVAAALMEGELKGKEKERARRAGSDALVERGRLEGAAHVVTPATPPQVIVVQAPVPIAEPTPVVIANPTPVPVIETKVGNV